MLSLLKLRPDRSELLRLALGTVLHLSLEEVNLLLLFIELHLQLGNGPEILFLDCGKLLRQLALEGHALPGDIVHLLPKKLRVLRRSLSGAGLLLGLGELLPGGLQAGSRVVPLLLQRDHSALILLHLLGERLHRTLGLLQLFLQRRGEIGYVGIPPGTGGPQRLVAFLQLGNLLGQPGGQFGLFHQLRPGRRQLLPVALGQRRPEDCELLLPVGGRVALRPEPVHLGLQHREVVGQGAVLAQVGGDCVVPPLEHRPQFGYLPILLLPERVDLAPHRLGLRELLLEHGDLILVGPDVGVGHNGGTVPSSRIATATASAPATILLQLLHLRLERQYLLPQQPLPLGPVLVHMIQRLLLRVLGILDLILQTVQLGLEVGDGVLGHLEELQILLGRRRVGLQRLELRVLEPALLGQSFDLRGQGGDLVEVVGLQVGHLGGEGRVGAAEAVDGGVEVSVSASAAASAAVVVVVVVAASAADRAAPVRRRVQVVVDAPVHGVLGGHPADYALAGRRRRGPEGEDAPPAPGAGRGGLQGRPPGPRGRRRRPGRPRPALAGVGDDVHGAVQPGAAPAVRRRAVGVGGPVGVGGAHGGGEQGRTRMMRAEKPKTSNLNETDTRCVREKIQVQTLEPSSAPSLPQR